MRDELPVRPVSQRPGPLPLRLPQRAQRDLVQRRPALGEPDDPRPAVRRIARPVHVPVLLQVRHQLGHRLLRELRLPGQLADARPRLGQPREDVHVGDPEVVEACLLDRALDADAHGERRAQQQPVE